MTVNLIALSVPAFFLLIAIELLVARRLGLDVYRFNDAITDLSCGIGQQVVGVFLKGALLAGYAYFYSHFTLVRFDNGSWVPWAIAFVGVDLLYYWWHRLSHEVAFMWAVHVVHHQSEDYNLAVALRQAWFSGATSWLFYLPLAFVGVPPLVFVAMNALSTLYQFWIHTRTVGKLGPIEWVLNTASHHRVHHGRNPKYLDKNYAATLIVWDRLFGTFQEEEEEPHYGVIKPYESWNPVWANFDFWAHLVAKARRAERWSERVRVFLGSPGYLPPGVEASTNHDTTDQPAVRYVTPSPRGLNVYVLAQFVPVTATTVLLMVADGVSVLTVALATLVLASSVAWGALFEGRSWALGFELGRLAIVAALAIAALLGGAVAPGLAFGAVLFAVLSTVWILRLRPALARASEQAVVA